MRRARSTSAPSTAPTTIPAIWPPVNPRRVAATDALLWEGVVVPLMVEVPVTVIVTGWSAEDAMMGSTTSLHREVVFEKTQQESVAFGELAEQYPHRPLRFVEKPQSTGSFCSPPTQLPDRESAGRAQLVKSARI